MEPETLREQMAAAAAVFIQALHPDLVNRIDCDRLASHLGTTLVDNLEERDYPNLNGHPAVLLETLFEEFPPPCVNGCPDGWIGRHKFSCADGWTPSESDR